MTHPSSDLTGAADEKGDAVTATTERQSTSAAAAVQEEARQTYRQSLAAELPLSGKALGSMFDRSERWGRDRIAEVQRGSSAEIRQDERQPAGEEVASNSEHDGGSDAAAAAAETAEAADERQPDGSAAVTPAVQWATRIAVIVVAAVAAAVSYEHMRHLSEAAGEGWRSWLLPLSVDGLMVAASMVMLVRKRQGLPVGALAGWSLAAGIVASLAANIGASFITGDVELEPWQKAAVAAWPPIALLLAYELLMQLVRSVKGSKA